MGKKPVAGLVGLCWVGLSLTGCGECCHHGSSAKFSAPPMVSRSGGQGWSKQPQSATTGSAVATATDTPAQTPATAQATPAASMATTAQTPSVAGWPTGSGPGTTASAVQQAGGPGMTGASRAPLTQTGATLTTQSNRVSTETTLPPAQVETQPATPASMPSSATPGFPSSDSARPPVPVPPPPPMTTAPATATTAPVADAPPSVTPPPAASIPPAPPSSTGSNAMPSFLPGASRAPTFAH